MKVYCLELTAFGGGGHCGQSVLLPLEEISVLSSVS